MRSRRPPARRPTRSARLRRSLRASTAEGVVAELVGACAGATALTGWALQLGSSPLEVALVGALPQLAQLVQLPSAWATSLLGRRRVAIWAVALSRQALLPLALVPLLPLGPGAARTLLLALAALAAALGVVGNNAWTAWMGELVPEVVRGRWLGRRTAVCTVGTLLGALAAGRFLDLAGRHGAALAGLAALAVLSSALGVVTTVLMARQHDPGTAVPEPPTLRSALRPLADPAARSLLAYQLAWNASVGLAGAWFSYHLLANLRLGYTVVAAQAAAAALAKVVTAPLWGRAVDRFGARPVLAACSLAVSGLPLLWMGATPLLLWPIGVDAIVGGAAWGGHAVASFAAPLAVSPRRERPFYLAVFSMAGGAAYGLGAAAGGALAAALPGGLPAPWGRLHGVEALFALSAAGRLASALLALRIPETGAATLGELQRATLGELHRAARGALAGARVAVLHPAWREATPSRAGRAGALRGPSQAA